MQITIVVILPIVFLLLLASVAQSDRQSASRRINDDTKPFKSPCGTKQQIAKRGAKCIKPLIDLVEGRDIDVPKGDADIAKQCERFANVEKCIRELSKDCLDGLHKTAFGSLAASSRRHRLRECKTPEVRAKYVEPIKCVLEKPEQTRKMYQNLTALMDSIQLLPISAEERMVKFCCFLNFFDNETANLFSKSCPKSVPIILSLQHSVTEDAKNTLCFNPKCNGVLEKIESRKPAQSRENFVEAVMLIVLDM